MAAVKTLQAKDLRDGMVIVGDKGGRYTVIEAVLNLSVDPKVAEELTLRNESTGKIFDRKADAFSTVNVED